MLPYIAGFIAYFALDRPRPLQGAALPQHRGDAVRPGDAGQGARGPGPAGAGVPRVPRRSPGTGSASTARSSAFAILLALLTCAVVAIPWHHAMLVRHGRPFWDELYGDNHWRRLVVGRHGDRGTFEYFVRELGYAVLPWIALAPAALAAAVMRRVRGGAAARRRRTPPRRAGRASSGSARSGSSPAYALVSLSVTKFHHYILPAIPGLAIAIGCFLDDMLARRDGRAARGRRGRRHPAAGAGAGRSGGRAQERAALHLAVLVRLHQHARRAALAARRSTSARR